MQANKRERIDKLADDIAVCAARIDSATHELLSDIRQFDELKGWAAQGAKSCAAWLCWRIGGGRGAAREKVRVARALGQLPRIDASLKAGELSYCKVRAMTRVATAHNEELLLHQARSCTGAQLEKICRGLRSVERRDDRRSPERFARKRHTADGMVRVELQLHPDEAELLWLALTEVKRRLRGDDDAQGVSAETPSPSPSPSPTLADAAVAMAEQAFTSTGPPEARPGGARRQLFVHLREDTLRPGPAGSTWRAELHDGTELSSQTLLRVACDSSIVAVKTDDDGNVLDVGRKRRRPSAALMRALRLRDRQCSFPGCNCEVYLEAHHIEHWARGGDTSQANTCLLCWSCHGLIHEGGFSMRRDHAGQLRFFEPNGRRIEPVPAAPRPTAPRPTDQELTDVTIDRRTSLPDWDGRPVDLRGAVNALVRATGRHGCQPSMSVSGRGET